MSTTSQRQPDGFTDSESGRGENLDMDAMENTEDGAEYPPGVAKLMRLSEEMRAFSEIARADLILEIRGLEVNRKSGAAFFRNMYEEKVISYVIAEPQDLAEEEKVADLLWAMFDELQWTLAYERQQCPGHLNEADPTPLPPSWKPCVAFNLYSGLLNVRWCLEAWFHTCGWKVATHPDVKKRLALHPPDLEDLRSQLKDARSRLDSYFQMMENMFQELSASRRRDEGQVDGSDAPRKTICKVLKEEINNKYPSLEVPDMAGPRASQEYCL